MTDLIGKMVEVGTVETTYTGKLVEINDNEVYLESDSMGWIMIQSDRIAFVRELE